MNPENSENPHAPNPYAVGADQNTFGAQPPASEELQQGILSQIRVVAIMLIVHGSMLLLAGIFFLIMAAFLPGIITSSQQVQAAPANQNGPTPEQLSKLLTGTYLVMGLAAFLPGLLQLVAGIRNLYPKGRTLGIIALFSGLLSVASCYCAPTSLGLLVYGLIIYFNPTAVRAFELGNKGVKLDQMLQGK
jgi:hypothetical protein